LGPKTPYALLSFLIQNFQFYRVVHFLVKNYYVKKQNVNLFVCFLLSDLMNTVHEELGLI